MSDNPEFLETADDVARIYGDRFFLMDGLPELDEAEAEVPKQQTLLTVVGESEKAAEEVEAKGEEQATESEQKTAKPERKASYDKPGIAWRPKENSQVLFILHQSELKNKVLTELLKQIVLSIGISFDSAGFGIIKGPVSEMEFQEMPNPYGIVFDKTLLPGGKNPMPAVDGSIFFTERLKDLQHDKDAKRELWNYLKSLKSLI
jgi:hypothetical protein